MADLDGLAGVTSIRYSKRMRDLSRALYLILACSSATFAAQPPSAAICEDTAGKEAPCHHDANSPSAAKSSDAKVIKRGAALKGAPKVTLAKLLADPAKYEGKVVRVDAPIRAACERKGCWMELAEGKDATGVRVTFKDYGFFVPLDSAGRKAAVEGEVRVAELSEARAEHYTSEGARVPRGADGKPREVQLVALGVELRK